MELFDAYRHCRLCPRRCGTDRTRGENKGFCGETGELRIAYVGPHFGEEPPLTGTRGSGTVFFSGCSLRCSFCQNHQISHDGIGRKFSCQELAEALKDLAVRTRVHNLNFVTPDHFLPHLERTVELIRQEGVPTPIMLNLSGYQSIEFLKISSGFTDIYLPDYKYSESRLAALLSSCPDYPRKALDAITEMVKQKGFLDAQCEGAIASKGVLARHLILPGHVENSINAITNLYLEFGSELPLSLMSQYQPLKEHKDASLNRRISIEEFERVYGHCLDLGFENLFIQFPEDNCLSVDGRSAFVPDFTSSTPFYFPGHSSVDNDGGGLLKKSHSSDFH
ncbi:MAG: radical SAM protein [Deltaproteobacteria bacterium CG_4_8_14_3_um_filter_51_11]|nr:radical SAM protein [bacterium]OIP39882.1 MAG: hypothetical protein AUK25_08975 [Desulfobacteraceae bacterium CG2_30_51_40]PIP48358.1 MAG: radical SAM protein [Deltaproteobacteria bacterium CG23_combo_of_CG06-09_8_20_14_all_51_20]PIX20349.1 MAG: radical SAM protein [Deltaproteobacteria bacterium CG_4_8_14_3_um_filter_51_11]PIY27186.1 MAG: radical SAM protein [Deltaproteobacteria bacterium CG_4_10_14_3_um_filter_51_14]PJB37524.1 MAG: radical SAM protein [Deltaproteobacteria bacterium CG_4_9_